MSPDGLFVFVADRVSEGRGRVEEGGKESERERDVGLLLGLGRRPMFYPPLHGIA